MIWIQAGHFLKGHRSHVISKILYQQFDMTLEQIKVDGQFTQGALVWVMPHFLLRIADTGVAFDHGIPRKRWNSQLSVC